MKDKGWRERVWERNRNRWINHAYRTRTREGRAMVGRSQEWRSSSVVCRGTRVGERVRSSKLRANTITIWKTRMT